MLKEGNAINLSLTALGSTIKALSEGKRPNFRDSKLTLLLQGSMTNGKVIMIAAVSPASICYDESMSTLRFAERIKMVKIKAKKNVTQDPVAEIKKEMEQMRKLLQEEIDVLKAQSEGKELPTSSAQRDLQQLLAEQEESEAQLKQDMANRLKAIESGEATFGAEDEDKQRRDEQDQEWVNELGEDMMRKVDDVKEPHLRNLNMEARLAETLFYAFKAGDTVIGRGSKTSPPDIEFNGLGMKENHCSVNWDEAEKKVYLTPHNGSATTVNGKKMAEKVELVHNTRVWLGNNYAFRFVFPGNEEAGEKFETDPDYFFAEAEITEQQMSGLPKELGHQLSEALKKVEQANIIATDLQQPMQFNPRIIKDLSKKDCVVVQVQMKHGSYVWPWEKFNLRLMEMVKKWQLWQTATGKGETFVQEWEYPFDDDEPQLIGETDVYLEALGNMIEHEADSSLLAPIGEPEGRIQLDICPLDANGNGGPWGDDDENDPFVESPEELLGKQISFVVRIKKIIFDVDLKDFSNCKHENVWVRYKLGLPGEEDGWVETEPIKEASFTPEINFKKTHTVQVDQDFLDSLKTRRVIFQVWGGLKDHVVWQQLGVQHNIIRPYIIFMFDILEGKCELCGTPWGSAVYKKAVLDC